MDETRRKQLEWIGDLLPDLLDSRVDLRDMVVKNVAQHKK